MAKVYVTYEQIHKFIEDVANDLKSKNIKPTGVYGPPRGGLIFATLLSYKLDIPLLLNAAKDCIIIDDIADSGRTLYHFTENDTQFNKYYIATMYYHKRSIVKPNFYAFEKNNDWIVFPYEYDN